MYLLDHEYSQRSLSWNRLKHNDALRVAALREAAKRLDCECFLALAEVHETWSCEGDDDGYGGRRRRGYSRYDDDGADDSDDGPHDLVEIIDDSIELTHLIGADGESVGASKTSASDDEVCFSVASADIAPFRSEHEGYQGNYGNTVDRWYHRAAFIAWPRANSFALLAAASPEHALDQLLAVPASDIAQLASLVGRLLPRWKRSLGIAGTSGLKASAKIFRVAMRLSEERLVTPWIAPVGATALSSRPARRDFVALVARYGATWAETILSGWTPGLHGSRGLCFPAFPETCSELEGAGSAACSEVATWLLDREVTAVLRGFGTAMKGAAPWLDRTRFDRDAALFVALLDVALAVGRPTSVEHLEQFLLRAKPVAPLWARVSVLTTALAGSPALRGRLAGSALHRACVDELSAAVHAPPRAANDWSIDHAFGCSCQDCAALTAFVRGPAPALDWPMSKPRRQHLHNAINAAGLPLSHATLRVGSPQVLQLRKLPSLFSRDAAYRAKLSEALDALTALFPGADRPRAAPKPKPKSRSKK